MIPIAGKPTISYIIDELRREGIEEFVFIVGYLGEKIIDYIQTNLPEIKAEFIQQTKRDGLGHAMYLAIESIIEADEVIIALGDSIIDLDKSFYNSEHSNIVIKKVKDPSNFGIAEFDEKGKLRKLVEKPQFPKSNEALAGWYKIKEVRRLCEVLEKYNREDIRTNGIIQLTDVLNELLNDGVQFETCTVDQWLDVGNGEVLLSSNAVLLKKSGSSISITANVENCVIIDPVFIGENCQLINSIIGPDVTISNDSIIERSMLSNGIVGQYTQIRRLKLEGFVIGSDSKLRGSSQSLTVGDNTELDFSK